MHQIHTYRFIVGLLLFLFASNVKGQITDTKTIACTASLETILRIQVTSGGSIEFVFNTITQLRTGVSNSPKYTTNFNIASSVNYNVLLFAEDANLIGVDNSAHLLNINNIGYQIEYTGGGIPPLTVGTHINLEGAGANPSAVIGLSNNNAHEAVSVLTNNYGNTTQNAYSILWQCGTRNGTMNAQSIIEQNIAPDRYVSNVFLMLQED